MPPVKKNFKSAFAGSPASTRAPAKPVAPPAGVEKPKATVLPITEPRATTQSDKPAGTSLIKMGNKGLSLLKRFEGCELKAYPDPATKNDPVKKGEPWTIGYGHTSMAGPPKVEKGLVITKAEAEKILLQDLVKYENAVRKAAGPVFTQNQFDAMVSLCYNIGTGGFAGSQVASLHKLGQYKAAAKAFMNWTTANGVKMNGLVQRRYAERSLYEND